MLGEISEAGLEKIAVDAYRLEKAAEKVRTNFCAPLEKISKSRTVYAFKERQKGAKRIYDKIVRKRVNGGDKARKAEIFRGVEFLTQKRVG